MDAVSPLPAIASLAIAITTSYILVKWFGSPPDHGRTSPIDGLRGYLALFVFLHHSSIWYFYLRTGHWTIPPSNLYTHFGQSSVALFFMITGFLFFSKLINGRKKGIDWGRLFVSRILRLAPLYSFVMILLFILVALLSSGHIVDSSPHVIANAIRWLTFTIPGAPNLNGVDNTYIIVAGVTWSLPYEWFFYLSLPLLALIVGVVPPIPYIIFGITALVGMAAVWHPLTHHLLSFAGGVAAAFLYRAPAFQRFAETQYATLLCLACIALTIFVYPSAYGLLPISLLSIAFSIIACGNSLFGALTNSISRNLGEMAYSIYLLHGLALFITFRFIIGFNDASKYAPTHHWIPVILLTPVIVITSFITFRFIEYPTMRGATTVTTWIRSHVA